MISVRFPLAPKMQKFAMTTCVSTISGIADIVETFLPSPPDFYGDPLFLLTPPHPSWEEGVKRSPVAPGIVKPSLSQREGLGGNVKIQ